VLIRVIGDVTCANSSGGTSKRHTKGAVNIYLYSAGDSIKMVARKKVKLAKLCPT
jgi:hypothetical protein